MRGRAIVAAAMCLASLSAAGIAQDQDLLKTILSDPAVQQHALEAATQSAVMLANPCPTARYALTGRGMIYIAPQRDASGAVVKGAWRQEVQEDGCGARRTLNVLAVVQEPKKLGMAPLLPGTTHAGPQLQRDAVKFASAAAGGPEKDCTIGYVENTEFVRQDGAPAGGAGAPSWHELWTFVTCTRRAHIPMRFTPDRGGTQIVAEPATIDPIPAKK
jgi:hypothetical protein